MRRRELVIAAAAGGAFLTLRNVLTEPAAAAPLPLGPLRPDPADLLELPEQFSYQVISRAGAQMDDGLRVPARHDGMAAFDAGNGRVALVCNHELDAGDTDSGAFAAASGDGPWRDRIYDGGQQSPLPGGTTTLIYDPAGRRVEKHFLSLAGTERNCAGGPTPWGSWLSCEESVSLPGRRHARPHGWVFEVPAASEGLAEPVPLEAMGRFHHEAVAIDPATGIAYLTEDRPDGLFYRFLPKVPGQLRAGGRLQALAVNDRPGLDTSNRSSRSAPLQPGERLPVHWIDLEDPEAPEDDLRIRGHAAGAARFVRGEGICAGAGCLYFACTAGGTRGAGQIFRYRPSAAEGQASERTDPGTLELYVEATGHGALLHCDNLVVSPWGDLIVCEDTRRPCGLLGITAAGRVYQFARASRPYSELAGVCFAPDGSTLFVNLQREGVTLAITGPFPQSPITEGSST